MSGEHGSIFSNPLNFCRSAIAALVRSPWRYCPFRLLVERRLPLSSVRRVAFVYAPPRLHAPRLRLLAARLRAQLCKLSTRRIKARSTICGSCSANNLAIQRSCSSLTLLVGRQGLARRAHRRFRCFSSAICAPDGPLMTPVECAYAEIWSV